MPLRLSDGGSPPREMAESARDLGHEWIALTDHSPRLTVAGGLSADRLLAQLELVTVLNGELAPFRILTGSRSTSSRMARSTSARTCSPRSPWWSPAGTRRGGSPPGR